MDRFRESGVGLHPFVEHNPRSFGSRIPFIRSLAASLKLWHGKNTAVNSGSVSSTRDQKKSQGEKHYSPAYPHGQNIPRFRAVWDSSSRRSRTFITVCRYVPLCVTENGTVLASNFCADSLAKRGRGATGLDLSCRRARFAFVSLRPVVLDLGV